MCCVYSRHQAAVLLCGLCLPAYAVRSMYVCFPQATTYVPLGVCVLRGACVWWLREEARHFLFFSAACMCGVWVCAYVCLTRCRGVQPVLDLHADWGPSIPTAPCCVEAHIRIHNPHPITSLQTRIGSLSRAAAAVGQLHATHLPQGTRQGHISAVHIYFYLCCCCRLARPAVGACLRWRARVCVCVHFLVAAPQIDRAAL